MKTLLIAVALSAVLSVAGCRAAVVPADPATPMGTKLVSNVDGTEFSMAPSAGGPTTILGTGKTLSVVLDPGQSVVVTARSPLHESPISLVTEGQVPTLRFSFVDSDLKAR